MVRDYFSFETIRDKAGEIICYHITAIGSIDKDGVTRMRSDLGQEGDQRMAFGKITIRGRDRMITMLLRETQSRAYWRSIDDQGPYCILSFAAREKHAEEIYNLNEGDRVLIEGRAYIRQNGKSEDRLPELSITVNSSFVLGRKRRPMSMNSQIVPQKRGSYAESNEEDETSLAITPQSGSTPAEESAAPSGEYDTNEEMTAEEMV